MSRKYSSSTGGFYDTSIHGSDIPADAVEITNEQHAALLEGQSSGKVIGVDADGNPILIAPARPMLDECIAALVNEIDNDADAIYSAALGNRATEYAEAEAQAQVFADVGYAGSVPAYVQAWADASDETAKWAADDILATAGAWRAAQIAIRTKRMTAKAGARAAAEIDRLEAVKVEWKAFVVAIRAQLGVG